MTNVKPTEQLIKEHDSILIMLKIIEKVCIALESNKFVAHDHLNQIIFFIKMFADKYHHGKEEDLLFPAMIEVGFSKESGPIGVMLYEHEMGRDLVKKLDVEVARWKKGNQNAISDITKHARNYIQLLDQHIDKENNILFPMANKSIPIDKQEELSVEFEKANQNIIEADKIEELQNILIDLKKIYLDE